MALNAGQVAAVKVGDRIGFKCDVEQYSEVYGVRQDHGVTYVQVDVTQGGYGHGMKWVEAARCFDHRPKK